MKVNDHMLSQHGGVKGDVDDLETVGDKHRGHGDGGVEPAVNGAFNHDFGRTSVRRGGGAFGSCHAADEVVQEDRVMENDMELDPLLVGRVGVLKHRECALSLCNLRGALAGLQVG